MIRGMDFVPSGLKRCIKLWLIRRKYPDCTIYSPFIGAKVELGRGCVVAEGAQINDGVSLGDYTYVNSGTIIFSGSIGRFCSIAYNCQIGPAEHPVNYLSTSPRTYGKDNLLGLGPLWEDYTSPPIIENDVWIGSNAIVLQGVHIGNGAIVAAGAVVNRDVPP